MTKTNKILKDSRKKWYGRHNDDQHMHNCNIYSDGEKQVIRNQKN